MEWLQRAQARAHGVHSIGWLMACWCLLVGGLAYGQTGEVDADSVKGTGEAESPAEELHDEILPEKLPPLWWEGTFQSLGHGDDEGAPRHFEASHPNPKGGAHQRLAYDASFEQDMFVQTDLVLPGIQSVQTVTFPRPRLWHLLEGSEIRLVIDHSRVLIPERSHLTVYVNDENVMTLRLTEENAVSTEVRIPIPLRSLKDYNELKMVVEQHYTDECEDPFDPALWTKVSRTSTLHLEYNHRKLDARFLQYPLPIFDRLGYGPTVLRYVLPNSPSQQTLQSLGLITAALGREVSYGHLAIGEPLSTFDGAPGNVILVGTPTEVPEIGRLLGSELRELAPGYGIVSLKANPTNPYAAVLVVTGNDAQGVLMAARSLANRPRYEVLSGGTSVIQQVIDAEAAELRSRPRFVPPENKFELSSLGYTDTTVRGFYASPIRIEVRALPDLQFVERAQRMRVYYSYGAQLDTRLSTLEVRWNNITLKSVPLDDIGGQEREVLDLAIPVEVIAPYNDLQFVFNLFPNAYDPCRPKEDDQLWGTLFGDTTFFMPRYHWGEMPDLGKLQYGAYPFGLYQDLSETAIVLPGSPDTAEMLAGLTLAGELGRTTDADRLDLKLVRASEMTEAVRTDRHLILIQGRNPNAMVDQLRGSRVLSIGASETRLSDRGATLLQAVDPNRHGIVEQVVSPFGQEKTVTVLYGVTPEFLKRALMMVTDIRQMSQLTGNIAFMGVDNEVRSVDVGGKVAFGEIPSLYHAEKWSRRHVWVTLVLLLVALILLFLVLKFLLAQYRRRNHSDPSGGAAGGTPPGGTPSGRGGDRQGPVSSQGETVLHPRGATDPNRPFASGEDDAWPSDITEGALTQTSSPRQPADTSRSPESGAQRRLPPRRNPTIRRGDEETRSGKPGDEPSDGGSRGGR